MALRFAVTVRTAAAEERIDVPLNEVAGGAIVKLGSSPACELRLEGLAPLHATVEARGNHLFVTPAAAVSLGPRPLPIGQRSRFDGAELTLGPVRIAVRLERVG